MRATKAPLISTTKIVPHHLISSVRWPRTGSGRGRFHSIDFNSVGMKTSTGYFDLSFVPGKQWDPAARASVLRIPLERTGHLFPLSHKTSPPPRLDEDALISEKNDPKFRIFSPRLTSSLARRSFPITSFGFLCPSTDALNSFWAENPSRFATPQRNSGKAA